MRCLKLLNCRDDASQSRGTKIDAARPNNPQNEKRFAYGGNRVGGVGSPPFLLRQPSYKRN